MAARRIFAFSTSCPYYFALLATSTTTTTTAATAQKIDVNTFSTSSSLRSCLILGGRRTDRDATHPPKVTRMLPQKGSPVLWLDHPRGGEVVTALTELPPPVSSSSTAPRTSTSQQHPSSPLLAIATQYRVMLVASDSLTIVQQVSTFVVCDTLHPIGSMCVSFLACGGGGTNDGDFDSDTSNRQNYYDPSRVTLRYLCAGLVEPFHANKIATLVHSQTQHDPFVSTSALPLLMAIRPDRFYYLKSHASFYLSEFAPEEDEEQQQDQFASDDAVLLSNATIRPALWLEPLCANAVALGRGTTMHVLKKNGAGGGGEMMNNSKDESFHRLLYDIIERFGRRSSNEPLKDDEGIGQRGAGITDRVYDILDYYGCHEALSHLMTGRYPSADGGRSTSPRSILPKWISTRSKIGADFRGDVVWNDDGGDFDGNNNTRNQQQNILLNDDGVHHDHERISNVSDFIHTVTNGDPYLQQYLRDPTTGIARLLDSNHPSSILMAERATRALSKGNLSEALMLLDMSGSSLADRLLANFAMTYSATSTGDKEGNDAATLQSASKGILRALASECGGTITTSTTQQQQDGGVASHVLPSSAMVALTEHLRQSRQGDDGKIPLNENGEFEPISDEHYRSFICPLAPSLQKIAASSATISTKHRSRTKIISELNHGSTPSSSFNKNNNSNKVIWSRPMSDSNHIWHQGPDGEKAGLLLLDDASEWLGRTKVRILGKEGAAVAAESGTRTLADILAAAAAANDDEENTKSSMVGDGLLSSKNKRNSGTATNIDQKNGVGASSSGSTWVKGVGEGREDEDNLSAYYRFSEGDDEDETWRSNGGQVKDLTKYNNVLYVVGRIHSSSSNHNNDVLNIEPTTTSVDEGEEGKVALLHDVVFTGSSHGMIGGGGTKGGTNSYSKDSDDHMAGSTLTTDTAEGLVIDVPRGSSADVGILHSSLHHPLSTEERQRCTIEFWFFCPPSHMFQDEVILVQRSSTSTTMLHHDRSSSQSSTTSSGNAADVLVAAASKQGNLGLIWQLVLLPSRRLEFRSGSGDILKVGKGRSSGDDSDDSEESSSEEEDDSDDSDDDEGDGEMSSRKLVSFQRSDMDGIGGWNHICLSLSSREQDIIEDDGSTLSAVDRETSACRVRVSVKGTEVASSVVSMLPKGCRQQQQATTTKGASSSSAVVLNEFMSNTALMFGLGATRGFRLTELRIWACERREDDIKSMMYEYLSAAEHRKKRFKIKIRGSTSMSTTSGLGGSTSSTGFIKPLDSSAKASRSTSLVALPMKKPAILLPERRNRAASLNVGERPRQQQGNTATFGSTKKESNIAGSTAVSVKEEEDDEEENFDAFFQTRKQPTSTGTESISSNEHSAAIDFFGTATTSSFTTGGGSASLQGGVSQDWNFGLSTSESLDFDAFEGNTTTSASSSFGDQPTATFNSGAGGVGVSAFASSFSPIKESKYEDASPTRAPRQQHEQENDSYGIESSSSNNKIAPNDLFQPGSPAKAELQANVTEKIDLFAADGTAAITTTTAVFTEKAVAPGAQEQNNDDDDEEDEQWNQHDDDAVANRISSGSTGSIDSLYYTEQTLLSQQVRKSVAAAILRGPPAARHFGGNRGGIYSPSKVGVCSISICGTEKTVLYTYEQTPPGKTYPIGASGAITSEAENDRTSQYLCCFQAKEKKLLVLDLRNKIMVVELKMTTKLNFWRCLPSQCHGNSVTFLLVTPIGAFHWLPLDEDPSPRLVWKRGEQLQGKKILNYEEGGSNGGQRSDCRSTVGLVTVSSSLSSPSRGSADGEDHSLFPTVEVWCVPLFGDKSSYPFTYPRDVICSAFCRPTALGRKGTSFLPLVALLQWNINVNDHHRRHLTLCVEDIRYDESRGGHMLQRGDALATTTVPIPLPGDSSNSNATVEPNLFMGTSPGALLLCLEEIIVVVLRRQGLIYAYSYDVGTTEEEKHLLLLGKKDVGGRFIVDATCRQGNANGDVDIVLLLCDSQNPQDGTIGLCQISRLGFML